MWQQRNHRTVLFSFSYSFSSKLRREELEHLRREVDQLKTRLSESHVLIMPSHGFWSPVLACRAKASTVLFTLFSFPLDRETGGGLVPPAGRGQRDQETVRTQLQGTHTLCQAACVCLWMCGFSQILNLFFCVLLFRRWRIWQTATELTAQIWQRPSLSIHTHKRRSARSGTCVSVCVCVVRFCFSSHML